MQTRNTLVVAATTVATVLVGLGAALPASAAGRDTPASVTVTGGTLSITVSAATAHLGTRTSTMPGGTESGPLGQVHVNDARGAAAGSGWVASVISTAFTSPDGEAIPASAVSYSAGFISKIGTATLTANDPSNLTVASPVVTATRITGDNSATWNPTINLVVPRGLTAGVYTATITHSVV